MYNTAGDSAGNVTQTFGYPAAGAGNGTQPADAPDTVSTTDSAGSVSTTESYDGAGDASAESDTVTGTAPAQIPPGAQDITYTPDGLIASVVLPGGSKATYQYDASGTLLYQDDPKAGSVLYLDGGAEQLTESTSGTVTGCRFYGAPDGSTVVRTTAATATGTGNNGGAVSYDLSDQQGSATQEITVTSGGGLAESRRYYDPYGNQESTAVAWGDNKGFVGDPQDADTGLDLLGARAYDPMTGSFLSPDPVYQPGTMGEGGYAYADDDPATKSDPTGTQASYGGSQGNCVGSAQSCGTILGNQSSGSGTGSGSTGSTPNSGSGGSGGSGSTGNGTASAAAGGGVPCNSVESRIAGACQVVTPTGGGSLGSFLRSLFENQGFDETAITFAVLIGEALSCGDDGDCVPPPDPDAPACCRWQHSDSMVGGRGACNGGDRQPVRRKGHFRDQCCLCAAGRVIIVAEAFYVGAYWGPRGEPVDECARRMSGLLTELGAVDSVFASWFQTGGSRKAALAQSLDASVAGLQELLLAGRARRDDAGRSVMSELGFSASIWNGQKAQVGVSVRCGLSAAGPGMVSNSFSMQLPTAEGDARTLYGREKALAVMRAVVASWQPAWATWTNHRLRKAQGAQPGEVVAGWATYVADRGGVRADRLPAAVITEPLGIGVLITAEGDADVVSEITVSAVRGALDRALRPAL